MVTLARLAQNANAVPPMLVTPLPIVMLVKLMHLQKALNPILVTPLGNVTLVRACPKSPDFDLWIRRT